MNLFKRHHGTLTSSLMAVAGTQCVSPGTGWSLSCRLVIEHSVLRETAGIDAVLHLISSSTQSVITCQDESEMVNEHEQPSKKKKINIVEVQVRCLVHLIRCGEQRV